MNPSSRKMAHVEYTKPKPKLISKDERQRQEDSLNVYTIKAGEANDRTGSN